ncbi:MAG: alpha/beta hydrolase, partial [Actinobacteria bacterium]|nr:alpha/beta hydrolase [Actinomycetota bacterium]
MLVGGYGMALGAWGEQAVALQASGNRVVRYDRRGHGTSDVSAHGQRMARHGKDVAEVLDALE